MASQGFSYHILRYFFLGIHLEYRFKTKVTSMPELKQHISGAVFFTTKYILNRKGWNWNVMIFSEQLKVNMSKFANVFRET